MLKGIPSPGASDDGEGDGIPFRTPARDDVCSLREPICSQREQGLSRNETFAQQTKTEETRRSRRLQCNQNPWSANDDGEGDFIPFRTPASDDGNQRLPRNETFA